MTNNPRPILSVHNNPKLVFNRVNNATSYKFRIQQDALTVLWDMEIPSPTFGEDDFYEFDYPSDKPRLEPLVFYSLIAEANDDNGDTLKTFTTEVMFLEVNAQNLFQDFQGRINSEGTQNLKDKWPKALEAILSHCKPGQPWPSWRSSTFHSRLAIVYE